MELVTTTYDWREEAPVPADGSHADEASRTGEEAFRTFMERNLRFSFRVAYALLRNRYDADDLVQDCFLRLYRKAKWQNITDEHAFLARVLWRAARDRQRRTTHEEGGTEMDTLHTTELNPEATAASATGVARIHRLIDSLPPELRQPLVLATLEELTSAQIAVVLGIPEGTVRTRIQRARALLKGKLAPELENRHGR